MKRMNNIFREDGKTVIIAMDHGMGMPVNPALDDTAEKIKAIVRGGADAILTTAGIVKKYGDLMSNIGVIMRADGGYAQMSVQGKGAPRLMYTVEDALRLGADAVVCNGFPGTTYEADCLQNVAELVSEGNQWNVPVMGEMLPGGFAHDVEWNIDNLKLTCRTGCEYGASIIKTTYVGPAEEFKKVVDACYAPVVILGGAAAKDLTGLFDCIEQAMSVGAAGVAIGRNVWNHKDPEAVTRALVDLVHNGAKAADIKL